MAKRGSKTIDWMTFSIYLGLIGIGWMMIFTVGYGEGYPTEVAGFLNTPIGKQTIWVGISLVTFLIIFLLDWKIWRTFANLIYIASMLSLVGVLMFGATIKGATSWFQFGGFSIQPSEFAKFATCCALAAYLSTYGTSMRDLKSQIYAIGLLAIPMLLIFLQKDAGSALVFLSFFILLYRVGFPANFYTVSLSAATLLILGFVNEPPDIILWLFLLASLVLMINLKSKLWLLAIVGLVGATYYAVISGLGQQVLIANALVFLILGIYHWLKKKRRVVILLTVGLILGSNLVLLSNFAFNNFLGAHQQGRIKVWLVPEECDPQDEAYNLVQSKMAIGSGGWAGKGFLKGNLTQGNFVPEQVTDFIFSTVGEEQGFVGSFAIIALFWLLMVRIVMIAERQRNDFSKYYAYGVAGIIFVHVLINIGMTMGLMPIIGIPLPFISKGGSALLGFTLLLAVLLKLDSIRYST